MASSVVSDNFETSTGAIPTLGGDSVETRLCSAWVNFDGTGTPAIRASYNVSSITDNGTGDYTVNFTTAMADANYAIAGMAVPGNGRFLSEFAGGTLNTDTSFSNRTTSSVRVAFHAGSLVYDSDTTSIIIFR